MAQFHVYKNLSTASKKTTPYLLDVQSNLLSDLATRVVVPLRLVKNYPGTPAATLMPIFKIEDHEAVALMQQLAAVSIKEIGPEVADLSVQHYAIVAALDFLISGF